MVAFIFWVKVNYSLKRVTWTTIDTTNISYDKYGNHTDTHSFSSDKDAATPTVKSFRISSPATGQALNALLYSSEAVSYGMTGYVVSGNVISDLLNSDKTQYSTVLHTDFYVSGRPTSEISLRRPTILAGENITFDRGTSVYNTVTDFGSGPTYPTGYHSAITNKQDLGSWSYAPWQWVRVSEDVGDIFTDKKDEVNFDDNALTLKQKAAIFANANIYYSGVGEDTVYLPNTSTIKTVMGSVTWAPAGGRDGRSFDAGADNDRIFGGKLDDNIFGGTGDDRITGGVGSDIIDGGDGYDFGFFDGRQSAYTIGGDSVSEYGRLVIHNNRNASETDLLLDVEALNFAGTVQHVTKWAELVKLSTIKSLNIGADGQKLTTPTAAFAKQLLGTPVSNPQSRHGFGYDESHLIAEMLRRDKAIIDIGGLKYTTIKPVAESLKVIFSEASKLSIDSKFLPNLMQNISSEGILVPRKIATDAAESDRPFSNHSWGTAIDLKVDGILDHVADSKLHLALAKLIPIFNKAGWVSGAGYSGKREDDMHFEASEQLLKKWFPVKNGTSGVDKFAGTDKSDFLDGRAGNDVLDGKNGIDTLVGGLGNDKLYGGADLDFFRFESELNARLNVDSVKDFAKEDEIQLDHAIFKGVGSAGQLLDAALFHIGGAASDRNDRIIYNDKTGSLYYDPDGSGKGAAVLFAVLENHARIDHADFFII